MDPSARSGQHASWAASAAVVGGTPDGAVACSYGLRAAEAAAGSLHIGRMLFKPVGGSSGQADIVNTRRQLPTNAYALTDTSSQDQLYGIASTPRASRKKKRTAHQ